MTDRLVKKIQKQKEGPLFDNSDNKYLQTNEEVEGIGPTEDVPNYKEIEAEINKNKTN